jgi:hypothetical protein
MTEIRHLRDRFPFCRFLAYGEAFDDDSASALLFFGADGVAGVNDGPAAVAQAIRRSIHPDVHGEAEPEPEQPTQTEPPPEPEAVLQPEPRPEASPPGAEPTADPSDEADDEDGPAGPPQDPGPRPGLAEEIWREVAPAHQERALRRMTREDIWDRQPSEIHFESPADE